MNINEILKFIPNQIAKLKARAVEKDRRERILQGEVKYNPGELNAAACWNYSKYGLYTDNLDLVTDELVKRDEKIINDKMKVDKEENSITMKMPDSEEIYEILKKRFESRGFVVFKKYYEEIDEMKFVIAWKHLSKAKPDNGEA